VLTDSRLCFSVQKRDKDTGAMETQSAGLQISSMEINGEIGYDSAKFQLIGRVDMSAP
jgi:hypothetical protein